MFIFRGQQTDESVSGTRVPFMENLACVFVFVLPAGPIDVELPMF
jgi:hypothetical protein